MNQLVINNKSVDFEIISIDSNFIKMKFDNEIFEFQVLEKNTNEIVFKTLNQSIYKIRTSQIKSSLQIVINGNDLLISKVEKVKKVKSEEENAMISPMPGKISKIFVKVGSAVKKNDPLLIMEAMKMEHTIRASKDGKIKKMFFKEQDQIEGQVDLVEIE